MVSYNEYTTKEAIQALILKFGMKAGNYHYLGMTSLGFTCNQRPHLECKYEGALKGTDSSLGFKHPAGNTIKILIRFDEPEDTNLIHICWQNLAFAGNKCKHDR